MIKEPTDDQKNAIWDDIEQYLIPIESRLPGDIDKYQFREQWIKKTGREITEQCARDKMKEIATRSGGALIYIKVYDGQRGTALSILRKVG